MKQNYVIVRFFGEHLCTSDLRFSETKVDFRMPVVIMFYWREIENLKYIDGESFEGLQIYLKSVLYNTHS